MNRNAFVPIATAALLCLIVAVIGVWRFGRTVRKTAGAGIKEACPNCGAEVWISIRKPAQCPACGSQITVCDYCYEILTESTSTAIDGVHYCETHAAEVRWEAEQLQAFQAMDDAFAGPPASDPAAYARQHIASIVLARSLTEGGIASLYPIHEAGESWQPQHGFMPGIHENIPPGILAELPSPVTDAYEFYVRSMLQRDNGSPAIFRWEIDEKVLYLVRCTTDGRDGFLEVYDANGDAMGHAITVEESPLWLSPGKVRRHTMEAQPDVRQRLQQLEASIRQQREQFKAGQRNERATAQ